MTDIYPHKSRNWFWNVWHKNKILTGSNNLMEHFRDNGYRGVGSGKIMHHERHADWHEFPHAADYGPMVLKDGNRVAHPGVPEPFRSIGPIDGSFGPLTDFSKTGNPHFSWIYGGWGKNKQMRYVNDDDRDPTPDEEVAGWAAKRLLRFAAEAAEAPQAQPFFMGIGLIRPHTPMHAPQKYFDMFPLDSLVLPPIKTGDINDTHYQSVFTDDTKGLRHHRMLGESYPTIEEGLKLHLQAYLACVAAVDDAIGTVLSALDRSPLKDNTIVIITSDHGWHNGQKGFLFKNSPWEESTRVPLIIRAPGVTAAGRLAGHPVGLIDIYPTLRDLCGLTTETTKNKNGMPLDGHSLRPFLENPNSGQWDGPDFALSMVFAGEDSKTPMEPGRLNQAASQHWSVRTEHWRYIRYNNGKEELYDHRSDPHEWTNLAGSPEHGDILAQMAGRLPAGVRDSSPSPQPET